MKHRGWIAFSGFLWFSIGASLLYKGLKFLSLGPSQEIGTLFVALGLAIGFLKGRFILSKTVARVSNRIAALPLPIRFKDAFSKSYWILIGCMMALGMLFRFLPISIEIRGLIDVAIGSALINGAMLYFRAARALASR